mmetsp:Transcript_72886/g.206148  ORF Transcript_72886/g.206148 Transcript_72886/m.206148 type:complete len:220 (-) Transcript_72886:447-1106(-)
MRGGRISRRAWPRHPSASPRWRAARSCTRELGLARRRSGGTRRYTRWRTCLSSPPCMMRHVRCSNRTHGCQYQPQAELRASSPYSNGQKAPAGSSTCPSPPRAPRSTAPTPRGTRCRRGAGPGRTRSACPRGTGGSWGSRRSPGRGRPAGGARARPRGGPAPASRTGPARARGRRSPGSGRGACRRPSRRGRTQRARAAWGTPLGASWAAPRSSPAASQ